MKELLLVVAVALLDEQNHILLAQRPEGKSLAGLWEFPGGKIEAGESPEQALVRELEEELGIKVREEWLKPLTFASHSYDNFHLLMPLYICRQFEGIPQSNEQQNLKWVEANELANYAMLPADIPLIPLLQKFIS